MFSNIILAYRDVRGEGNLEVLGHFAVRNEKSKVQEGIPALDNNK